jgi:hypothetical protein
VLAPAVDVFWTPGYWGWGGGFYAWHAGYWGPHVGFYGGVNYGYGYGGNGYEGGRWERGSFHYNRAVNNVNVVNVHNTYNTTIINNNSNRVSFNGGDHGTRAQPTSQEIAAAHDNHIGATRVQEQHVQAAREDRSLRFSQNRGNPANAATSRPFSSVGDKSSGDKSSRGDRPMMKAPDAGSRAAQGHMPSSGFAPHGDNGQRNQQRNVQGNVEGNVRGNAQRNSPRAPQVNGMVNDRAATPHRDVPSSSYAPRERPQNAGAAPQGMRPEAPRAVNPGAMNGPAHQRMGGGEARHGEGARPESGHGREQH